MKQTVLLLLVIMLGAAGGCGSKAAAGAAGAAAEEAAGATPQVNILSMGDIAQVGPGQARVAAALEKHVRASGKSYDGLFTAGDNFYMRLSGVDDPKWRTLFEEMYNPAVLNFPFYVALGNHDYDKIEGGEFEFKWQIEMAYARKNPQSRWKLPAKWYRVDLPARGNDGGDDEPLVSVLVFDSYKTALGEAVWAEQLAWLRSELERPRKGRWLVAVAHHPLYSNGSHGDNGVMQRELGPLFERHGLDLYICGHDHDLQHLEMPESRTSFMLVGGGGAATRPMRVDARGPFSRAVQGFADLSFTRERVAVRYIGVDGSVVHAFERTRGGKVIVLETTGTDRAVPRRVKDVTRPDAATRSATTPSSTTRPRAVTRPTTAAAAANRP